MTLKRWSPLCALLISSCASLVSGCASLIPSFAPPPNVYELDNYGHPKKENGATDEWVEVDELTTIEANRCQTVLFIGSRDAKKVARTGAGLKIAGGAISIAGGLTSTTMGLIADQGNVAIKASTITAAGVAAVGGVIALIGTLVQNKKIVVWEQQRELWDDGYAERHHNPETAQRFFTQCTRADPGSGGNVPSGPSAKTEGPKVEQQPE